MAKTALPGRKVPCCRSLVLYTHAAFSLGPAPGHDRARCCKLHAPSCQGTEVGTGIWSKLVKMCGVHCAGDAGTRVSAESRIKLSKGDEVLSHAAHYSYSPHAERPNGLRYEGRLLAAELILA